MLFTMEMNPERAERARGNFARAGLADRATVIVGDAQRMLSKVAGPFEVVFQDGPKQLYTPLLDRLVELLTVGGLLITDNVLWDGEVVPGFVAKPQRDVADTEAIAEYNRVLNCHPRLRTATIPLRDGVAVSVKVR
jgi:predicted O-methyltransferase YrrM